jgi:hypothetical protein
MTYNALYAVPSNALAQGGDVGNALASGQGGYYVLPDAASLENALYARDALRREMARRNALAANENFLNARGRAVTEKRYTGVPEDTLTAGVSDRGAKLAQEFKDSRLSGETVAGLASYLDPLQAFPGANAGLIADNFRAMYHSRLGTRDLPDNYDLYKYHDAENAARERFTHENPETAKTIGAVNEAMLSHPLGMAGAPREAGRVVGKAGDFVAENAPGPNQLNSGPAPKAPQGFSGRSGSASMAPKGEAAMSKFDSNGGISIGAIDHVRDLVNENGGKIYVRWSRGPEYDLKPGARSKDYQSGQFHEGLSANPIEADMDPHQIAKRITEYSYFNSSKSPAKPYLYSAVENGIDSDGTPTVANLKYLGSVDPAYLRVMDDDAFLDAVKARDLAARERHLLDHYGSKPTRENGDVFEDGWWKYNLNEGRAALIAHEKTFNDNIEVLRSRYGPQNLGDFAELAASDPNRGSLSLEGVDLGSTVPQNALIEEPKGIRAAKLGYSETPFYRGEASGVLPAEYPSGAHFSRDHEYAQGFATKGGQEAPREFRLNLQNAFDDGMDLTAAQYSRMLESAARHDPKLAVDLAESIAPGKGIEWLHGFARHNPDYVVASEGGAAALRHAIERSAAPENVFRDAGFDAISNGRDVRKLAGTGIRSADAKFDPARAHEIDILAGLAGAGLIAPAFTPSDR